MNQPNFFIIGAPKCGTTSLAGWLAAHPQIYMSPVKEPHFFDTDLAKRMVFTSRKYHKLFASAKDSQPAIGEASTYYLFSDVAIPKILQYDNKAKFITLLRNPVDMAYALHQQETLAGNETVSDFKQAWSLQPYRKNNLQIPSTCVEPAKLQYGNVCLLGRQVHRLLQLVPRERAHFILIDDLKRNARQEYLRTLNFLNLPDDGKNDFPISNSAKQQRSVLIQNLLRRGSAFKKNIGIYRNFRLNNLNAKHGKRPPLDTEFRVELAQYFRNDILLLEKELGKDLSHWLT